MRTLHRKRDRRLTVEPMAGWVFADLLLVLFLMGLGSTIPVKADVTDPAKPDLFPVGMQTKPEVLTLTFNAGRLTGTAPAPEQRAICTAIKEQIKDRGLGKRQAALVLVFAQAAEPTRGVDLAERIGRQLACANKAVFGDTVRRAFWKGGVEGQASLEVYLFTNDKKKQGGV